LRVLDLSQGMSGPLAAMILADHGAQVLKVEPPWGDWARELPGYLMWNRGKEIASLDLREDAELRQVRELASSADVLIDDWRPGSAAGRGLDRASLAVANPGIVTCSISAAPLGRTELMAGAYDAGLAAAAGRMVGLDALSGAAPGQDRPAPLYTAAPTSAYGAAMLAVQGILAALHQRESTGIGRAVATSLLQAEAAFLMRQDLARGGPDRAGVPGTPPAVHRGIVMCFLTAECGDGRFIQMCARQDQHFRNWMAALGLSECLEDPRYRTAPLGIATVAEVEELEAQIRERMLTRTQAEWMELFSNEFDVGADPFLTPEEFLAHPQMLANDRVLHIDDAARGQVTQPGPLVLMSETPVAAAPSLPNTRAAEDVRWSHDRGRVSRAIEDGAAAIDARPLSGVTVLELAYFVAGPLSATMLAELGARVIKVEPPEGDPSRRTGLQNSKFLAGKESVALDLKSAAGSKILDALLARSDALVHNFRPGVPERLGFGFTRAQEINPRLVYLYAGSYGSRGPQAHRTAFHSTPNALCGGGILQAGQGNPPVDDSYCDPGSGLAAATGLLLGLAARERTGKGQYLETSMLSSAAYVHSNDLVRWEDAPAWRLPDKAQHGMSATYRLYRCSDGWVFLSAWRDRDFARLAAALGRTDWAERADLMTRTGRLEADAELAAALTEFFAGRLVGKVLGDLSLPRSVLTAVSDDPLETWFEEHDLLAPMDHPEYGPYWQPLGKFSFDGRSAPPAPTCSLGEHTASVLGELGYTDSAIADLVQEGVIRLAD
jgi:crotonobetainyl-CoA:carnitine CoA-transferase CaiB-like acyl-CoA transferase